MKTFKFKGEELFLEVGKYGTTGRLAVLAYTKEELYGDVTINLPYTFLDNEKRGAYINEYTKMGGLEDKLIKLGIIEKVVNRVKYNFGTYDEVLFDIEKLREYDKEGVEKYLQDFEVTEEEEEF